MKIKEITKIDAGFQYVFESMEFMSAAGRRLALESPMHTAAEPIEAEWDNTDRLLQALQSPDSKRSYTDLRHCLMQLHDLQGTLTSLSAHTTLNEVELFELKNLAQLNQKAIAAIAELGLSDVLPLPNLQPVFATLDPDSTGIVNFYIYDSYDQRLAPLRRELKSLQEHGSNPQRIGELLAEQSEIQQQVCIGLSDRLLPYSADLSAALHQLAYADLLQARAELVRSMQLVRPTMGSDLAFRGLVNPRLRRRNEEQGLRYQPVDVSVAAGVTLITGANMAGKTVLLKSIATAQYMAQCGMFVPAAEARITIFDDILTSIGDEQNEMNGLSSYASEITKISRIVARSAEERLLVLIDEPARTTNPTEGKALVQAIITILEQEPSVSLITTHYGGLGTACKRLRVRGFVEDLSDLPLTPQNINHFIDYSLTDDPTDSVPHEALRIATILGCDSRLIDLANQFTNNQ